MLQLFHITILDQYSVDIDIILGKGSTGCVYPDLQNESRTQSRTIEYLLNMQKFAIMKYIASMYQRGLNLALNIFYQLLLGYKDLVQNTIVYRGLKPANIMLHNDIPKIINFGYCQIKGFPKSNMEYNIGSPSYMAPNLSNIMLIIRKLKYGLQKNIQNRKALIKLQKWIIKQSFIKLLNFQLPA